jgi:ribonuclease-3
MATFTIDTTAYEKFAEKIGVQFKDITWLVQACTHRSFLNEHNGVVSEHNERLEFLGDAVLELVVTHYLFYKFPDRPEGELTAFRSALVNTKTISQTASQLDVNDMLLLSKGEQRDLGKARHYILANAYEAIIGALYCDQGYTAAEKFITATLLPQIDAIVAEGLWRDAKSYVQEKSQETEGVTPSYHVLKETGPDHDKNFTIGIYFGEECIAEGSGKSKQEAEQEAARKALIARKWTI